MNCAKLPVALLLLPGIGGVSGACGSPPEDQPDPLEGVALVSGSSLERYGLLVIPRDGGVAQFRSIESPSAVRWTGRLSLGSVTAAHSLGSAVVLQRGRRLHLYATSPVEAETPLPDAPAAGRWIPSPSGGAFVSGERILAITATRTAEVSAGGAVHWAAPAAGDRVVALVEGAGGPELAVWEAGESQPAATRTIGTSGPVALAGWGRTIVTASEDGRGLTEWSIPELEAAEGAEIGGAPSALAISPSQHRVFAASPDRPGFTVIDRYDWREVGSSRVEAPLETLRPGMTGDRLVAWDGSKAWSARAGEAGLNAVPGEWRADLPLALPGGAVLVSTESGLGLLRPDGDVTAVEGPPDAWWLPFRWGRRLPVASAAVVPEDTLEDAEEALDALADSVPPGRIGLLTVGRTSNRSPQILGDPVPGDPLQELPAGYYAVAQSSRQLGTLGQRRELLDGPGYSTHVLRRMDAAGDIWYRLLVGPYETRPEAERASLELRRERGIDAWIHEEGGPAVRRDP
ncbi:MAG: SPOR domain-containing protein [Gemmatimonadales bacterium]|nr:SPOR domain-containing protein [Gemmatimonadales bacterium]MYG49899.1 SPOR domain-containing protein [Gemmatimonadales bacterium]MYK01027.1 SPOR domain-containing protein [Candidatus Palauibacter ramosifaciens]